MTAKSREDVKLESILEILTEILRLTRVLLDRRVTEEATPDTVAADFAPIDPTPDDPVDEDRAFALSCLEEPPEHWLVISSKDRANQLEKALPHLSDEESARLIHMAMRRLRPDAKFLRVLSKPHVEATLAILSNRYGWEKAAGSQALISPVSICNQRSEPLSVTATPGENGEIDIEEVRFEVRRKAALKVLKRPIDYWMDLRPNGVAKTINRNSPYLNDEEVAELIDRSLERIKKDGRAVADLSECRRNAVFKLLMEKHHWKESVSRIWLTRPCIRPDGDCE